jgi:uncharacterized protein YjiS (DUF1127 family)
MSTTYGATGLGQTAASTRRVSSFFKRYWGAFQERRKRQRLRVTLCDLSDRELMDIGTTRGEIDYVASNRGIDPRGIRSARMGPISANGGRPNWTLPDTPMPRNRLPIGVKSAVLSFGRSLPLYPYQQTFSGTDGMSQMCR